MTLLAQVRDLRPRFELLFRHPTPAVAQRHADAFELLEEWLVRPGGVWGVPGSIDTAVTRLHTTVHVLRDARELLPDDDIAVRMVVDTNASSRTRGHGDAMSRHARSDEARREGAAAGGDPGRPALLGVAAAACARRTAQTLAGCTPWGYTLYRIPLGGSKPTSRGEPP